MGNTEQARAAFAESLEIARQLAAALPRHTDFKDLPGWLDRRMTELETASEEGSTGGDRGGSGTTEK